MRANLLSAIHVAFLLAAQTCLLQGQTSHPTVQQCSRENTSARCVKPPNVSPTKPSAAQEFPYPGADSPPAETEDHQRVGAPPSSVPDKKGSDDSKSPANAFPYPGEAAAPLAESDAGASSSSSSASTNDPDIPSGLNDLGSEGTSRRRLPKVTKLQTDEERADEDLNVATFYRDKGDLSAAYLRIKDAVKFQPKMADAHLALAQIARKMKKNKEAASEFKLYLDLDPGGEKNKDVPGALAGLK